jgi:hypothetical protein
MVVGIVAVLISALAAPIAGAQSGGGKPKSSENGVTDTTITVTVVAAIEVPGFPGLFQGSHDGVDSWADYINNSCKPKNTCVAGRKIEVKHFDSKLSGDEARAAFRQACSDSFALIGTGVLLLQNFDDITQCTDAAGAATGLPDFGVTVTEPNEQCSGVTFGVNPASLQCDSIDQHPQTYIGNAGASDYYQKKFGKMKGAFLYPADSASAKNSQVPNFGAQKKFGITDVYHQDLSALAPQSAYTSIAGGIRDSGATYARSGLAFDSTVKLRKEAAAQNVTSVKVWDCSLQCYDSKLVAPENADAVEGEYVYFPFLPFLGKTSEAKTNKTLSSFVKIMTKNDRKLDGFSIQAFAAGLYFDQAIADSTKGGSELTRKGVIEAAGNIHDFDANGVIAPTDVGGAKPSGCYVLTQVRNGEFVRVFPKKKGTIHCSPKTVVTQKLDLLQ